MKIELLMSSVGLEFTDRPHNGSYDNWPYDNWSYDRWDYNNWTYQRPFLMEEMPSSRFLDHIILRTEQFGGILFDLITKAVFYLDTDAYRMIEDLKRSRSFDTTAATLKLTRQEINELHSKLVRFRLCSK